MPNTPDYTSQAASYAEKLSGQSRSNASAAVKGSQQFDRDNLLYFIEDKFKTNVKGGFKLENLRAFLHFLVKSCFIVFDDSPVQVIAQRSGRIVASNVLRFYYGSTTYGYMYQSWSSFTTNVNAIDAAYSHNAIRLPYDVYDLTVRGFVKNSSSTGNVSIHAYYGDQDNGSDLYVQNMTLIGTDVVNIAATNTNYDFVMSLPGKVPQGKMVWIMLKNDSGSGSSEIINIQATLFGTKRSSNWTAT
jgi:hypothetical protein|tara:strand:+ start:863 stop:1597 length:735 start_codon:yes stop_codon:yes gene_type:complete